MSSPQSRRLPLCCMKWLGVHLAADHAKRKYSSLLASKTLEDSESSFTLREGLVPLTDLTVHRQHK